MEGDGELWYRYVRESMAVYDVVRERVNMLRVVFNVGENDFMNNILIPALMRERLNVLGREWDFMNIDVSVLDYILYCVLYSLNLAVEILQ